jgi:hypothetical protein
MRKSSIVLSVLVVIIVVSESRWAGVPSAGILTRVKVAGGGPRVGSLLIVGSSVAPRIDHIEANIARVGI